MARPIPTFVVQQLWWLLGVPERRLGFQRRGIWTRRKQRAHSNLRREFHVGLICDSKYLPNIVDLHAFWLNERCRRTRFSVNPDPASVDVIWVYAQDPLDAKARTRISAISAAEPNMTVFNRPEAYDFYHRPDSFELLASRGVPVPRSKFEPADVGTPVLLKPLGGHSRLRGPLAYPGPANDGRPFEFFDVRDEDGLYRRYRAIYLFGRLFQASAFASHEPIVRYGNAIEVDRRWRMTEIEADHVVTIAETSGLDFFAVDFVRRRDNSQPVFTDINSFPVLKDIPRDPGFYGYLHDFDNIRPFARSGEMSLSAWDWVDEFVARVTYSTSSPS